jgi:predicted nucleic acid-binding protein
MKVYADTAFLCSLYAPDAHTARAAKWMAAASDPLPVIGLHRLELRNALRLRVFRKEIDPEQRDRAMQMFLSDLAARFLLPVEPAWSEVLTEAERLSAGHTERVGTRSLDILHVASAVVLGMPQFLTFDTRQADLASSAGLRVLRP